MSNLVSTLVGILPLSIVVAVIIGSVGVLKKQSDLDQFSDELAAKVSNVGKCEDEEIQNRFDQLVIATGLNLSCEITSGSYVTGTGRPVQYGEAITIVLALDITEVGWGNFKIPIPRPMVSKRVVQSMQYWK